jgi:hypothetical protein
MIRKTDIKIGDVYVARSVYNSLSRDYAKLLSEVVLSIKTLELIKFYNDMTYRIGPCYYPLGQSKDYTTLGIYHFLEKSLEISPRQKRYTFILNIIHELIHAEQHYTGQYKLEVAADGYVTGWWENVNITDKILEWEYYDRPWEINAIAKEIELVTPIYKNLIKREVI